MAEKHWIRRLDSPVGRLTLSSDGAALTGLWIEGQKYFADTLPGEAEEGHLPVFDQAKDWLRRYFEGDDPGPVPPLAPRGSAFQQAVWAILRGIPCGQTTTYGKIAREMEEYLGRRASAQAVGGAVGRNPISIIIPCHRVVGAHGAMTGYAGGVEKKVFLLRLEGHEIEGDRLLR